MRYDWDFSILVDPAYAATLLQGTLTTLELTGWCVLFGTPLGVALGVSTLIGSEARLGITGVSAAAIRTTVLALVDIIRAVPLLLLIVTSYYVLPVVVESDLVTQLFANVGLDAPAVSGFQSVVVAMALNLAAFVADLVRAAAVAVPRGSIRAARALGMSNATTWRRVILPEVFREILPGLTLLYITMLKMTTLASVVAVYEVLHSADAIIQQTYRPLELYVAVCGIFLAIVIPLSVIARYMERTQLFRRRS